MNAWGETNGKPVKGRVDFEEIRNEFDLEAYQEWVNDVPETIIA